MELINKYRQEMKDACVAYMVQELYVFGSVLSDQFTPDSDIDFIVSISTDDPLDYAENYFDLKFALEKVFNRKIDLLEEKAISNKVFARKVNQEKVLVYER